MAKRRRRTPRRTGADRPGLRPVALSALLGAALVTGAASPGYAAPVRPYTAPDNPAGVPDSGSRPAAAGSVALPGAPTGTAVTLPTLPAGTSPLAAQVEAKRVAVALAGEQLLKLRDEQAQARTAVTSTETKLRAAQEALATAQQTYDTAATEALKAAAGMPPGTFGTDLHGLGALSRLQRSSAPSQEAATRELAIAQEAEKAASTEYSAAIAREQALVTQYNSVEAARQRDEAALRQLQQQDTGQLAAFERQREADEQRLGAQYVSNQSIAGKAAHPLAMAAVEYALKQVGKPYVWAAEGPNTFDCSGLVLAAYVLYAATPYVGMPRVARDQYYATRTKSVDRGSLLPGDLVFFGNPGSWTTIHHVGIYLGNGRMVNAANSQQGVVVSAVWWSQFFAATRPYGAVDGPATTPAIPAPTTPKPAPSPGKSPTPKPTRSSPPPATDPTTPDPSASPSTSTSTSPSPSHTPTESPSPTPSETPSPSVSNRQSPDTDGSIAGVSPSGSGAGSPGN